jgi:hypothetical protein
MHRPFVVLLISSALGFVGCTSRDTERSARIIGSKIYFVPIGDFSTDQMQQLANYYHRRFGLEIPILKTIAVPTSAMDSNREQLVAEKLVTDMRNAFPELAADPQAILIGSHHRICTQLPNNGDSRLVGEKPMCERRSSPPRV